MTNCNCGGIDKDHAGDCPAGPSSYQDGIKASMKIKVSKDEVN